MKFATISSTTVFFPIICLLNAKKAYDDGEKVTVYVNKVGPYKNPQETYHYYQLPVCTPAEIVHKKLTLSEVINGDRMAESLYNISFKVDLPKTSLCKEITVGGPLLAKLARAIEANYYFEFVVDDIFMHNFIGQVDEETLFPHNHKTFLFTHYHFLFEYNDKEIVTAKIVLGRERPLRIEATDLSLATDIFYTYGVEWRETKAKRKNDDPVHDDFFPQSFEIHWLSVINSSLLVFLLLAFVILILIKVVRSDLSKYNFSSKSSSGSGTKEKSSMDDFDDHGWKVIHGDVFRSPKFTMLLSAILGVGCQLLSITATILTIVLFNLIDEHTHGLINSTAFVLYAFTSGIAGYVSASVYKKLNGQRWIFNVNLTFSLFSVPCFLVWCFENSLSWAYNSTQALPYQTVVLLLALWALVGYPLTLLGGVLGKNCPDGIFGAADKTPSQHFTRVRQIPRELPSNLPYYHSPVCYGLIGGFLPFSAISVELYYIFATVWGHESYTLYGVLSIVFIILLSVTACVSIALTYFQLSAEDYRWWWRSVFAGGSTGFFVFAYSLFFFFQRSEMSGFFQTAQFFGCILLICYGFFISLGTISFFASWKFVRYIYGNIKTE